MESEAQEQQAAEVEEIPEADVQAADEAPSDAPEAGADADEPVEQADAEMTD